LELSSEIIPERSQNQLIKLLFNKRKSSSGVICQDEIIRLGRLETEAMGVLLSREHMERKNRVRSTESR